MHPIIDALNGGKLWLGGAAAAKNPNFLIENKQVVFRRKITLYCLCV